MEMMTTNGLYKCMNKGECLIFILYGENDGDNMEMLELGPWLTRTQYRYWAMALIP